MATAISNYDSTRTTTFIRRNSVLNLQTSNQTMCCWVIPDTTANSYMAAISQANNARPFIGTRTTNYTVWTDALAGFLNSTTSVSTSSWYFIAETCDTSGSGLVSLYIGNTPSNLALENSVVGFYQNNGGSDINVCRYRDGDVAGWDGKIVYTRVFNSVLTLNQLKELMVNPEITFNNDIIYWMKLNSDLTEDFSGNGNTGTVTGTFGTQVNGPPVSIPTMLNQ